MNLTPLPTLQKIVLLKLAVTICSEAEVKCLIEQYVIELDERSKAKVKEKISSYKLPESLQRRLMNFIKPVMMEISSWILYIRHIHDEVAKACKTICSCLTEVDIYENLRWQTIGLIAKEQTSLNLVRDRRLDTFFRFVLACNCCFETDIRLLGETLSSDVQELFPLFSIFSFSLVNFWVNRIIFEWIEGPHVYLYYTFEYLTAMYSFYDKLPFDLRCYLYGTNCMALEDLREDLDTRLYLEIMFEDYDGELGKTVDNIAAMKYCYKYKSMAGKVLHELVAMNHFISNEILVFCLSQMSDDQLISLVRSGRGSRVLSCFVNSPWQESFWSVIDRIWDDLRVNDFSELLTYIVDFKIKGSSRDFDLSQILKRCGVDSDINKGEFRSNYRKVISYLMNVIE